MKKLFRRIFAVVIVFVMLLTVAPLGGLDLFTKSSALGLSGECGENVTYTFKSSTGLLTISGTGEMENYNYGDSPFYNNSSIKTIVIEDGVTCIGYAAFYSCKSLTSVTIGNSITSIGHDAFGNTGYSNNSSNWEDNVLYIGNYLIEARDLSGSYKIKDGTKVIADYAFLSCQNVTSVTIPDSVTNIGEVAFENCINLASVTIGNNVISIGENAFSYCTGLTSVTIPDSVTSIGDCAFYNCTGLTSVTIGNGVTSIGWSAFENCTGLTTVTIPDSVTSISRDAFAYCINLVSVTIGNNVSSIGIRAFAYCINLASVTIGNRVCYIDDCAFYLCPLEDIYLPRGVYYIGPMAFLCLYFPDEIKEIIMSEGLEGLEEYDDEYIYANASSSIKSIKVDANNPYYDSRNNCNAIIETESNSLILGCNNTTIPSTVTGIYYYSFALCKGLTSISIPENVTKIGEGAFIYCTNLTTISIPDSVSGISYSAFNGSGYYNDADNWEDGVLYIGNHLIYADSSVSDIYYVKENTTTISDYAFNDCNDLISIVIPDSILSIDSEALCYVQEVFYAGTQDDWNSIDMYENSFSEEVYIHYEVSADDVENHCTETLINEPDCTNAGRISVTCDCGYSYEKIYANSLGHVRGAVVETVAPTCEDCGYTVYHCTRCDCDYDDDYTDSLGHICSAFVETIEPSCLEGGYTVYHCDRCDNDYYDDYTDPLGHNFENGQCTRCEAEQTVVDLSLTESVEYEYDPIDECLFKIAPEESGTYYIYAFSELDTIGILYDSDMNQIAYDDDGGSDYNFNVSYYLDADETYYLKVSLYDTDQNGTINIEMTNITPAANSNTVIDAENGVIYGIAPGLVWDDLSNYVSISGSCSVSYDDYIGTGSTYSLLAFDSDDNELELAEFTFILFGDVDGNGWYDATDSIIVNCLANGMIDQDYVGDAVYMAADCNHDGVVDSLDVAILEQAGLVLSGVDQSQSTEELESDSVYQEYVSLIDQSVLGDKDASKTDKNTDKADDSKANDASKTEKSGSEKIENSEFFAKFISFIKVIINFFKSFKIW